MSDHLPGEKSVADQVRRERADLEAHRRLMRLEPVVDIDQWQRITSAGWSGRVQVREIRCKWTPDAEQEWLFVVKGLNEEGAPVVAFHGDRDVVGGMASLARRLVNGNLKWREDRFYGAQ